MLLVCPSCASAYDIPGYRIGPGGRTVRCKRCATTWFATQPDEFDEAVAPIRAAAEAAGKFALDPVQPLAIEPAAAVATAADDGPTEAARASEDVAEPVDPAPVVALDQTAEAPAGVEIDGEVIAISARIEDDAAPPAEPPPAPQASLLSRLIGLLAWLRPPPRRPLSPPKPEPVFAMEVDASPPSEAEIAPAAPPPKPPAPPTPRPPRAGFALGRFAPVAAFAGCCAAVALIAAREPIAMKSPAMARLYAAVGLAAAGGPVAILGVTSDIGQSDGVEVLMVEGEVVNRARTAMAAPALRAIVRDAGGVALYEWPAQTLKATLEPGERTLFRARLATPPPRGHSVEVRIAGEADNAPKPGKS